MSALFFAAVSAILPGAAHLRAGRYPAGVLLFAGFLSAVAGLVGLALWRRNDLLGLAVRPGSLMTIALASMGVGAIWALMVLRSYLILRPLDLSPARRAVGRAGVTALCLLVITPFLFAANYAYVQRDLVTSLFSDSPGGVGGASERDPWEHIDRLNVLLLGSDFAENRIGVRTDSIHLASIDPGTGRTVLISLPRNLEDVPLPPGPLRQRFPFGFDGLLNEIFQLGVENRQLAPPGPRPGPALLKQVVSQIVGMPVHYYAMVDLKGFRELVDAMGGVHLCVERDIPYGHQGRVVRAGCRKLDGSEALWYGRSRTLSDDYDRMKRQRCLIDAMVEQADPVTMLRRYQNVATAVKQIVVTDIPQHLLPDLVTLGLEVKGANFTSLQLVPPLINPAYPNFPRIRHLVQGAIQRSEIAKDEPEPRHRVTRPSPKPSVVDRPIPPPTPGVVAGRPGGGAGGPGSSPGRIGAPQANQDACG